MSGPRPSAWHRLTRLLGKSARLESDEELRFHFDMRVRDYMRRGMNEAEARRAARERLGDVDRLREEMGDLAETDARAVRRREWLSDLRHDLRYGARMLRRAPTFSAMSVLTLALGIGATTAIFSVVWAVLLAPLPYPQPDRLVNVWETTPRGGNRNVVSAGNVRDWQERARSFDVLGAYSQQFWFTLTGEGEATRLSFAVVQPETLRALGVPPVLGRTFDEGDDGGGVVLLAHGLWQARFGGDADVLGRRLVLDDVPYTVVGVMPPGFTFPGDAVDLWVPFTAAQFRPADRMSHNHQVVARLADGATIEGAQAEMAAIASELAVEHPEFMTGWGARVVPLHADLTRDVRSLLHLLLGGVCVVLLTTCANIANLLLARAVGRQREMAVRGALGAGRGRIVRQLLTESAMLTGLGAAGALMLAPILLGGFLAAAPPDVPLLARAAIDGRMLAFTAAVAVSCAMLFGVAPAVRLGRMDLSAAIRTGRDRSTSGHVRLRSALLVSQVALSVVLLVGAGLFVRSFGEIQAVEPGFDPGGLVLMEVDVPEARYAGVDEQLSFYERLIERVDAMPQIASAAGTAQPPGWTTVMTFSFLIEGREASNPSGREDDEPLHAVTAGYFETLGRRMVAGRTFDARDDADGTPVVVVNESFARKHFPDGDALGQRIMFSPSETTWREIVGVVEDARLRSPDQASQPGVYLPFEQKTWPWLTWMTIAARGQDATSSTAVADGLRGALREIDPELPPIAIRTVEDAFRANTARRTFAMTLVGGFGLLALVLSVVGLYGLISYSVARERRDIGVRMALGAHSGRVLRRVLSRALWLTFAGSAMGLLAAVGFSRIVRGLLYGVSPVDATAYGAAAVLVLTVALATAAVPAWRAARTDPVEAIRAE